MVILIVEDDKKIRSILKAGLEHQNFTTEAVQNGEEALRKVGVFDYDLIILDVMLPGKNGFEVCGQIRAMNISTPILMLSARGITDDRVLGLNAGADDYLAKPFDFKELVARVHALMRRQKDYRSNILAAGPLELDISAREVRVNGSVLELTGKQFRILEYLIRRKGLVCTRSMLMEHVWGFNKVPSNSIEVHILELRNKLAKTSGLKNAKFIKTIYGKGYKIIN